MTSIIREALKFTPASRSFRIHPFVYLPPFTCLQSIFTALAPHIAADIYERGELLASKEIALLAGISRPTFIWTLLLGVDMRSAQPAKVIATVAQLVQPRRLKFCNVVEALNDNENGEAFRTQKELLDAIMSVGKNLTHLHIHAARGFYTNVIAAAFKGKRHYNLSRIRSFTMNCVGFSNSGLEILLPCMPLLHYLNLEGCSWIVASAIPGLIVNPYHLETLALRGCCFDADAMLPQLCRFENLSSLSFTMKGRLGDAVDSFLASMDDVAKNSVLSEMRKLDASNCGHMTSAAMNVLTLLMPNLEHVHLSHCRNLTNVDAFVRLQSFLSHLDISATSATDITPLLRPDRSFPRLSCLKIAVNSIATDFEGLHRLTNLEHFDIHGATTALSSKILDDIAGVGGTLQVLDLSRCSYRPEVLVETLLSRMRMLRILRLGATKLMQNFIGLTNDTSVNLLTDDVIEALPKTAASKTLHELDLSYQTELTAKSVACLGSAHAFPRLSNLSLCGCTALSDVCELLNNNIKILNLRETDKKLVTTEGLIQLLANLRFIGDIDLPANCKVATGSRQQIADRFGGVAITYW